MPVDVNASGWHATIEVMAAGRGRRSRMGEHASRGEPAIRLGLEQVHGLGEAAGRRIESARRSGRFGLLRDLAFRAQLDRESLLHLARAGALETIVRDRRRAVWEAMRCLDRPGERPLFEGLAGLDEDDALADGEAVVLPVMSRREEVLADYRTAGLSLRAHPLQFDRGALDKEGIVTTSAACLAAEGRRIRVAGIVLSRQRPATAAGMIFLTIEDETGAANVVVRPNVWEAANPAARKAAAVVVHGRVQRRGTVVHVVATAIEPFSVPSLPRQSRDFH